MPPVTLALCSITPYYPSVSKLLRYGAPAKLFFVTTVTYQRSPILVENYHLLREAVAAARATHRFDLLAWVVLPDHLHAVLDTGDASVSTVMQRFKMSFAARFRKRMNMHHGRSWQKRFWDHIIRNQNDLNKHIDYIHFNPVKHGLTAGPRQWRFSSIHERKYARLYPEDWGVGCQPDTEGDFGE